MRLVGIELASGELRIVEAERGLAGTKLLSVTRIPVPDARTLEHALDELAARRPGRVLSALPLAASTHRILSLPFRDRRRLARTAPLELLGQLPGEIAGVHVATERLATGAGGSVVLAVAVHETDVREHDAVLASRGLTVERLDLAPLPVWNLLDAADAALLVADGRASTLSLRRDGRLAALRALGTNAADGDLLVSECRRVLAAFGAPSARLVVAGPDGTPDLLAALADATGLEVTTLAEASPLSLPEPADDSQACAVALGLVAGAGRGGLELRPPRHASPPGAWRRATALAAAVLVLGLVNVGVERVRLARYDDLLVREIAAVAARALPGEPNVAARAQLEAAIDASTGGLAAGRGAPVLEVLRELSARVPPALSLDVSELTVDDAGIRVHGRAASFDAVDSLARALAASPLLSDVRTEETRTAVDGRGVLFRLGAKRKPPEGTSL
jgi:hypothetical protein